MNKRLLIVLTVLVLCTVISGCTTQQEAPVTPTATTVVPQTTTTIAFPAELTGSWTLTTMGIQGGRAVMYPLTDMTLTISADGTLTGYNGCNNYFASYTLTGVETPKGQGIIISDLSNSTKYCETLEDQDQIFLNILSNTNAFAGESSHLAFTSSDGNTLAFQRQPVTTPTWDREY